MRVRHKKCLRRLAVGAVLLAALTEYTGSAADGVAVSASMSISEVVDQIVSNNPGLRVGAAEIEAEVASLNAANVPGATSIEYSPFFGPGSDGLASSELIVKQSIDFPTQYGARSKMADARRRALDEGLQVEARKVRLEAATSCVEYIGLQKQTAILKHRLAVNDSIGRLYQRKLERGSATQLEVNRILLTSQELQRELLGNSVAEARIISALTLLNGGQPVNLSDLDYDPAMIEFSPSLAEPEGYEAYMQELLLSRPEIKAADAEIVATGRELSLARGSWLPEISLGYRRNTEGKEVVNGFLVGLDFSLFSSGKESKAARLRKTAAELQRDTETSLIRAEVENTLLQMMYLRSAIDATDTALFENTLALYARSLALGQITLTDYCRETDLLYQRLAERARLEKDLYLLALPLRY